MASPARDRVPASCTMAKRGERRVFPPRDTRGGREGTQTTGAIPPTPAERCQTQPSTTGSQQGAKARASGLLRQHSGRKAAWRRGAAPRTRREAASDCPGTGAAPRTAHAQDSHRSSRREVCVSCFTKRAVPRAGERKELKAPTMAHCASVRASGQLCSDLWPSPHSPGHSAGQRPKGKGQTMGAETKLDQLIHAKLFKSF